jgi:hypothetical protein
VNRKKERADLSNLTGSDHEESVVFSVRVSICQIVSIHLLYMHAYEYMSYKDPNQMLRWAILLALSFSEASDDDPNV